MANARQMGRMSNFVRLPSSFPWEGGHLQNKWAIEAAVPHFFRKKPYSRLLGQTKSYCLQTRVPRVARAGSSIACWSIGPGLPKPRSPPS